MGDMFASHYFKFGMELISRRKKKTFKISHEVKSGFLI